MDNLEQLNRGLHEKWGWTLDDVHYAKGDFDEPAFTRKEWRSPDKRWRKQELPALHLSANLCIAELDRVFADELGPSWSMVHSAGKWAVQSVLSDVRAEGATFNEAALKALIAVTK